VLAPDLGDADALADVVGRTERMMTAMVPLLDEYFEEAAHVDEGRADGSGGA